MGGHDNGSHVPDEPETPMWLPALGALLFLVAGIWWATRPSPQEPAEAEAAPAASASASGSASAQAAPVPAGHPGH